MYTLVVVDMQPLFDAANGKRVRENCLKAILRAIEINAPIIFLEFSGYNATLKELTAPVAQLNNYYVRTKSEDDGSSIVQRVVVENKLPQNFRVCGINTDCCVYSTVEGLSARFPKSSIEVIAEACDSDWNHMGGINRMTALGGVVVVVY